MKFRMSFGTIKVVFISIVIAACLAIVGLDIALLTSDTFSTAVPAVAIVSLVAAALILVISLLLIFNSYYSFKDDMFICCLCVFVDKIKYDEILSVKQNTVNGDIFLLVKGLKQTDSDMVYRMNLSQNNKDAFLKALTEKKPNLVVEMFTPENKK